jgi:ribosomal protein S18 acetylase RimI-like enzyme
MVELREACHIELPAAAQLLALAMRDDPMYCAVFGADADHRRTRLYRLFGALLPMMRRPPLLALDGDRLVGVLGQFAPGSCHTTPLRQLQFAFAMRTTGVSELWRLWRWISATQARDLVQPHWHLGPVAVVTDRRGQGIGSQMLREFCARMDERGEIAFLETDKPESVRFYARCGFLVSEQGQILGTPNWWMHRPAKSASPAPSPDRLIAPSHKG